MPSFLYSAVNEKNKYIKDRIEARSQRRALADLERLGLLVVNIKQEKKQGLLSVINQSSIRRLDKILFTRHLHTLLESGIALDQALKIASEQAENHSLKKVLTDLYQQTKRGEPLHGSLARHPRYFSPFFVNLVRVGEKSGTLDNVLEHLLEQQERDYELITKTRSALIYPAIIIMAAIGILTLMMAFVIPNITELLLEYNVDIPLSTKILIWISAMINHHSLLLLTVTLILFLILRRWIKSPRGKLQWDWFKLNVPILKRIVVEFNMARICRSMSALLKSGVSIDEALLLTSTVCGNLYYQRSIAAGVDIVRKGIPMTEVLHGNPRLYPIMSTRMIEIGERTGKFDNMFTRLALFYEKSVLTTIQNLSSIIEPVLLLIIGLGVAFVAVSILTPIWRFAQTI